MSPIGARRFSSLGEEPQHPVLEAGRVGQQVGEGDRLAERSRHFEVGQIVVDVAIELELPLLDELHHGRPHEELGDRADPKERAAGVDGTLRGDVGEAVALRQQDLAVAYHRHRRAGGRDALEIGGEPAVEERFELGRVDGACGLGDRRRRLGNRRRRRLAVHSHR
jgi:hypothetical protein